MGICTSHACSTNKSQKRASDPLALKLQTLMNCHVGAGKGSQDLCRSNMCF